MRIIYALLVIYVLIIAGYAVLKRMIYDGEKLKKYGLGFLIKVKEREVEDRVRDIMRRTGEIYGRLNAQWGKTDEVIEKEFGEGILKAIKILSGKI